MYSVGRALVRGFIKIAIMRMPGRGPTYDCFAFANAAAKALLGAGWLLFSRCFFTGGENLPDAVPFGSFFPDAFALEVSTGSLRRRVSAT